ncbi:MAG: monovalent cation/H+ antiporter subunit D family protein [Desulfobacterales bacterium]|nr:monovalent cation/H+ antiporter subunit D family protein [Desulfobacterales bacterium]MBL7207558.1 monovalent cation/H+ antiporter subunit D family protein [Desulfobacterales bacterium]
MTASPFPILIVVVPLISAFFVPIIGWWKKNLCYPLVIAALSISALSSIVILNTVINQGTIHYYLGNWDPPWGIEYVIDHFGAFMALIVSFVSLFAAIYAKRSVEQELPEKIVYFYCAFLLLIGALLGIVVTGDLFNLYVFLEIASIAGYALIAIGEDKARAPVASFRYLIMGTIGACFYLIGVGYLYIVTGSLNMADLKILLSPLYANEAVRTAFVFIFIGLSIKIAFFPLHTWQPDAYTYAPSVVSVIISTAMAKTYIYALIRIIFSVFTLNFVTLFSPISDIICWVSAIAMIVGSIYAIRQFNLKRMLAYSSIANVGYIMLGVGLCTSTSLGLTPALMHILNHALMKGCMFMASCAFIYKAGLSDIRDFTGLGRKMPYTCFAFTLAALAMIGMPPGVGFISKWYLILAALEAGRYIFVAVIFFSTLLMIVYFFNVIEIMYLRVGEEVGKEIRVNEAPISMLIPGLVLGFLCFVIGVIWMCGIPLPILEAVNSGFGLGVVP